MNMLTLEIFSLLKHQSNSINSLVTLLDLLERNCIKAMLEMIEDEESRPKDVDSLRSCNFRVGCESKPKLNPTT